MTDRRHGFGRACKAGLLALLIIAPGAHAQWTARKFKVFFGEPAQAAGAFAGVSMQDVYKQTDSLGIDVDNERQPAKPVPEAVVREIEQYLAEMASELERMGFAAPQIEPIVRTDSGEPAYRVFVYDFPNTGDGKPDPTPARWGGIGNRKTFSINAAASLSSGSIPDKLYQDLPHELFHGIQPNYPLFAHNPYLGDWIVEGTAQAIGADMAAWYGQRRNYPNRWVSSWILDRWGLRWYDAPLWVRDDADPRKGIGPYSGQTNAYGASSFWRYLGEYAAFGGVPSTVAVKPDYRFMIDFFNSELGDQPSQQVEMQWIDRQLKRNASFNQGLDRVYPNFVSTFAGYINDRIKPSTVAPQKARDVWLSNMFHQKKCPPVLIDEGASPIFEDNLDIPAVASRCYRIRVNYQQPTSIYMEIRSASRQAVGSIVVATSAGNIVAQPIVAHMQSQWLDTWFFEVKPGADQVFTISNVSRDVQADPGRPFSGHIKIVSARFMHNLYPDQGPQPAPNPAPAPNSPQPRNQASDQNPRHETAGEQVGRGLESLSPNMAQGGTARRIVDQKPCADAFQYEPCGPRTHIHLSLEPGVISGGEHSTGRGGAFGQFSSLLSGVAEHGLAQTNRALLETGERMQEMDGATINMSIPLIDYGFTGSFNNAWIEVSARGGGSYQAIGPRDNQPGPGYLFPLSGRVTIEEYSPSIMRGKFAADLVNLDKVEFTGEDMTLPIHQTISGSFRIVAPWRGDDRVEIVQLEDAAASVLKDVRDMNPGVNTSQNTATSSPGAPATAAGGAPQGGHIDACDCSCNAAAAALPLCEPVCRGTWLACKGEPAALLGSTASEPELTTVAATAEQPYLLSMPSACELLDPQAAAAMLDSASARPWGAAEYIPTALSSCAYADPSNARKKVQMNMQFTGFDMFDSRKDSPDELRTRAAGFLALGLVSTEDVKDLGNIAFVYHQQAQSFLKVFTGIYGKAPDSDSFGTELVVTYTLADPGRSLTERSKALLAQARPHIAVLQTLARTSHGAAD